MTGGPGLKRAMRKPMLFLGAMRMGMGRMLIMQKHWLRKKAKTGQCNRCPMQLV